MLENLARRLKLAAYQRKRNEIESPELIFRGEAVAAIAHSGGEKPGELQPELPSR